MAYPEICNGGGSSPLSLSPLFLFPFSLPFPSLPLEVGPLKSSWGSGGALWAPPAGFGAEPQSKSKFGAFWQQFLLLTVVFVKLLSSKNAHLSQWRGFEPSPQTSPLAYTPLRKYDYLEKNDVHILKRKKYGEPSRPKRILTYCGEKIIQRNYGLLHRSLMYN